MKDYRKAREFAIAVAKEAGDYALKQLGKIKNKELTWKLLTNFKTKVDDDNDELIRQKIEETFPGYNILSEEQDPRHMGSKYSWVVDPLDGTLPYRFRISNHWSVCMGLVKGREPVLGVIYAPERNEMYVAEKGKGAYCNEKLIHVSLENNINHIMMGIDSGKETEQFKRASMAPYVARAYSPEGIMCSVSYGCASVPLSLVAKGNLHAYMALSLEPWDMAAAVPICREAGAKVTDIHGKPWELGDESILVANPRLHAKLSDFLELK